MNPFLKWITAHRHAQAARDRAPGAEGALRRCPNCHRSQPVPEALRGEAVRCEGCGVPIPPEPAAPR